MKKSTTIKKMTAAGLLIAVGIVIPLFSPFRLVLEPASFTLASHVALFLSMFISPLVAVAVAIGTTFGFFLGGFPLVVVFRAASHVVFAFAGAVVLQKKPQILATFAGSQVFSFSIALLHAAGELVIASFFYFSGATGQSVALQTYAVSILLLVGLGTLVHSMVDFAIALLIFKALSRQKELRSLFVKTE